MELMYLFLALGIILFLIGITSKSKINVDFNTKPNTNILEQKKESKSRIGIIAIGMMISGTLIIAYTTIESMSNEIVNNQGNEYQNTKTPQGEMRNVGEVDQGENINEFYAKAKQEAERDQKEKILQEQQNDGDLIDGNLEHEGKAKILRMGKENHVINIDESGALKWHAEQITAGCNGDEWCEKSRFFTLVSNIPYHTNAEDDFLQYNKKPMDVLNYESGDCDEKSFLLVSLLLEKKYKAVIVFVKKHAFVAMNIQNARNINPRHTKLTIKGLDYYYADVTNQNSHIGTSNKMKLKDFIGVYDVNTKRLVDKREIEFYEG